MVRVLVVEDSKVIREFLQHILQVDPQIEVVGTAENGEAALAAVERLRPDVVTMDIHMPRMDGYEATRRIMETTPTPVVIVSGSSTRSEVLDSFRALENGALAVLSRPVGLDHPDFAEESARLRDTVKVMSEVKVVRRWPRAQPRLAGATSLRGSASFAPDDYRVVAIGASTGGPLALHALLAGLVEPFPLPILVVQHMAVGFLSGFVDWLNGSTRCSVMLAQDREVPRPGFIYIAPDQRCMTIGSHGQIELRNHVCVRPGTITPSVSDLFKSVLDYYGQGAIGILLSGMGSDGAAELKLMRDGGAYTIAQDKASCTVYGMPGEAARLGGVEYAAAPEQIARKLNALVRGKAPCR